MDWQDRERSGEEIQWDVWNSGMKRIYDLIADDVLENRVHSIMDLGAGQMYLRELLPDMVTYTPVDYCARCPETVVCDFNLKQFPNEQADVIIAAGVTPFISDLKWFFEETLRHCRQKFILTYTPLELEKDVEKRERIYLWRNHYTYPQLCRLLYDSGFLLAHVEKGNYGNRVEQVILIAEKAQPESLPRMTACTGCGVCAERCPTAALEMAYDEEGFLRPMFHAEQCVHCGECLKSCPALHFEAEKSSEPETLAVWAPEELRLQSSSGGAFSLLALEILRQGGAVCGARYQPETSLVEHAVIRSKEELPMLRGSKYVQSDMRTVYQKLRSILEHENAPVLFCGCPCQVAALYAFLGKRYDKLYTIDLLCGGVTAPKLFQRYLTENWDAKKIKNVNCRTKEFGWDPLYLTVEFQDGTRQIAHRNTDPFEKLFHSFAGQRECCYACAFSTFPRQGDITLGDFWGIQNYDAALDDGKGTSFVSLNSEKGKRLFESLYQSAAMVKPVPWQYTGTNRLFPFLAERVRLPAVRERFYHLLKTYSYRKSAEMAVSGKYDVAVVCNWSGYNYGAQLTQYAFYCVLTDMGLETVMIERPDMPYPGGNAETARLFRRNPYPSYATHTLFKNTDEMREMNDLADTFIVPSDQLWNALFAEKDLFALGYVANNKKKISYATSFGCDPHNWQEDERAREMFFLSQFDAVSVREDSGIKILEENFGVRGAEQTLDPVLLHDANFYRELCKTSQYSGKKCGIAAFILDPNEEKEQYIRWAGEELGLESTQICDVPIGSGNAMPWDLPVERNIQIEDWLAVIQNSEFVITDSFHGVCLAIVFQKRFVAIGNVKRGLARFESILRQFHLEDRLVLELSQNDKELLRRDIDYDAVAERLKAERERSLHWLDAAIKKPKQAGLTAYDILDRELLQEKQARKAWEKGAEEAARKIDSRQSGVDAELLRINGSADAVNAELLRINRRADEALAQQAASVEAVNAELLRINGSIDSANAELLRLNGSIDAVNAELLRINQRADGAAAQQAENVGAINAELLRINGGIDAVNAELLRINQRADKATAQQAVDMDAVNAELLRINQRADAALNEMEKQNRQLEELRERIGRLETSFSYKLGRFFTWLPRKIREFILRK